MRISMIRAVLCKDGPTGDFFHELEVDEDGDPYPPPGAMELRVPDSEYVAVYALDTEADNYPEYRCVRYKLAGGSWTIVGNEEEEESCDYRIRLIDSILVSVVVAMILAGSFCLFYDLTECAATGDWEMGRPRLVFLILTLVCSWVVLMKTWTGGSR